MNTQQVGSGYSPGCRPTYSSDLNLVEQAFLKLKAQQRKPEALDRYPLATHRQTARSLPTRRMRQLLLNAGYV